MSLEMLTFVPAVDDARVPAWLKRLGELGMDCEIHPDFSFASQTGFLPFKLRLHDSGHPELNDVDFLSGFEFCMTDFSLEDELRARAKESVQARGLFRRRQAEPFASPEIDEQLRSCRKRLEFVWGVGDLFELRMATVSSAVLAEITGGLSCYPADGLWYERTTAAEKAVSEARAYEDGLKPENLKVHRFEKWL